MYIDIIGYSDFTIYVRNDAESGYDYVTVWIDGASVRTVEDRNTDTSLSGYTEITYNDIDEGPHRISIRFKKDEEDSEGNQHVRFTPVPAWETPAAMDAICQAFDEILS